jgi:methylmalonyl-CoA mutase
MAELPLARDFPSADEAAWKTLVEKALKGAPFASLESKSYDGIVIEPLYRPAKAADVVPGRAPATPWAVIQRIEIADGKTANRQILDDLNNGANGFALVCQGSVGDYGYGMAYHQAT